MITVREHLIFKALAALYEIQQESREGPIKPSWSLRFCLAYLFSQSHGGRETFEYFWTAMQEDHSKTTDGGRYMRHCNLGRAMSSIIHRLGFNDTARITECLGHPHRGRAVHDFWSEVQVQLDDGRPMPVRRFKRG